MPGMRLGPYEIVDLLGEGGMGQVYLARDTKLNREVALKLLLPSVAPDSDRLARFRREAQVLAALKPAPTAPNERQRLVLVQNALQRIRSR